MPSGTVSPVPVNTSPSGAAGGDLTGTYPNPTVAAAKITAAKMSSGAATSGQAPLADGAGGVAYGSPSVPGAAIVRGPFSFAFNTAGLTNGVTIYTPTVSEILYEAWIEVTTAFDGTTPKADIGTFVGTNGGLGNVGNFGPIPLDTADNETGGTGVLIQTTALKDAAYTVIQNAGTLRIVPARFTATNPLLLVVSQNGQKGGAAIGGAAGAGRVYIVTATPVAL